MYSSSLYLTWLNIYDKHDPLAHKIKQTIEFNTYPHVSRTTNGLIYAHSQAISLMLVLHKLGLRGNTHHPLP